MQLRDRLNVRLQWSVGGCMLVSVLALWLTDNPQAPSGQWRSAFPDLDNSQVIEIHMDNEMASYRFQRVEGVWYNDSSPVPYSALVNDLVGAFTYLEIGEALTQQPSADFGLVSPKIETTFTLVDGDRTTVSIGLPTPDYAHEYIFFDGSVHVSRGRLSQAVDMLIEAAASPSALHEETDASAH